MNYTELKAKQSKEINDFPLGAAFTQQSFEKMMKKWGLTTSKEDCKKILSLGCGCYIRKADEADFDRLTEKHQQERVEFLATDEGVEGCLAIRVWKPRVWLHMDFRRRHQGTRV